MSQSGLNKSAPTGVISTLVLGLIGGVLGRAFSDGSAGAGGALLGLGLGVVAARLRIERARGALLSETVAGLAARIATLEQTDARVSTADAIESSGDAASASAEESTSTTASADPPIDRAPEDGVSVQPPSLPPTRQAPPGPEAEPSGPSPLEQGVALAREWLFGGNTVVRGGVLVLLVGVTLLARWAAENSLVPIEARLAFAALIGLALVGVGFRLRGARPGFGTTLQGGGLAALYLVSFMSFRLYELIPVGFAFGLFIVIAAASGTLAVLQRALPLIVIASLGGFLAPILASTGSGNHVALFSYYLVLNISIAAIAFIRSWRVLNLLAFVLTYGVATAWGVLSYEPDQLATTLPFVFAFLLLFTGESLLFAWRQPPELRGIVDGTLVFGTPLVSLLALAALLPEVEMGLAIATALLALLYAGVAYWLWRTAPEVLRQLSEAFIAIAVGLGTMAVPFAFEDSPTTAIVWALEGAGVHWVGVRQSRRLARITGLALQPLAAIAFWIWTFDGSYEQTQWLANGRFLSTVALAFAGLAIAREADRVRGQQGRAFWAIAQAAGVWGLAWWSFGVAAELADFFPDGYRVAAGIGLIGLTAVALHAAARALTWESGQVMCLLSLPVAGWVLGLAFEAEPNLLAGGGFVAWPLCLAASYWVIHQLESSPTRWTSNGYAGWLWLCSLVVALALYGIADSAEALGADWEIAGLGLGLGGVAAVSLYAIEKGQGAFGRFSRIHYSYGVGPILLVSLFWGFVTNFSADGSTDPLPYLPLLNPIDLAIALVALTSAAWALRLSAIESPEVFEAYRSLMLIIGASLAFAWLNAVLARSVVQWTGVDYELDPLWDSISLQVCLSIAWTLVGVAGMWLSTRRHLRQPWMAFAGLLAITVVKLFVVDLSQLTTPAKIGTFLVVGVLLLIVGYFSPVPPEAASGEDDPRDDASPVGGPSNAGASTLVIWVLGWTVGYLALGLLGAGPSSAEDEPHERGDFAWSRSIDATSSNVIQVVELPFEVYRDSVERGLNDVRVFDAAGTAVPHAIAPAVLPESEESVLTSLPLFAFPEGKTPTDLLLRGGGYRVDIGIEGGRATLQVEPSAARSDRAAPSAYLVDTSDLEGEVVGLEFDLAPESGDFLVPLRIDATDDLVDYEELVEAAVVARLTSSTDPIEQTSVEFRRSDAKYLRISWPTGQSPPSILGVKAVQRAPERVVARVSARIEAKPLDAGSYLFDLESWPPVDRIQVDLGRARALVSAEVFRASERDGPWRRIYRGLVYRVGPGDEPGSRNAAIEVSAQPTRYLRVDIAAKGGGAGRAAPTLEVFWPPEQLYFLDQGGGPHTLVSGKLGAPAARFEAAELLAISRSIALREKPISATATLGSRVELSGRAATLPESGVPVETIVLWAVLLGAVGVVGGLALRLVREMRE